MFFFRLPCLLKQPLRPHPSSLPILSPRPLKCSLYLQMLQTSSHWPCGFQHESPCHRCPFVPPIEWHVLSTTLQS